MKVFIGIPVYDGNIPAETARCLISEVILGMLSGHVLSVVFLPNCSHPALGRNQLANDFLKSDFDRLFFLDSDITFKAGALIELASLQYDLVGGAYRYKCDEEKYPVGWISNRKELWSNCDGLIEVETLPTGFMSISRRVFEKFIEKYPERNIEHFGHILHCFFYMPYRFGQLFGEDACFCQEWRELGGEVFLKPDLDLTHWQGNKAYPGNIGSWLKSRQKGVSK